MFGKRILLGITGGIAAYKIAFLIRLLKKSGAEVRCIMTPASSDFISPLVVATLSENPVGIEFWDKKTGVWANHVEYGLWADLFVIAPLTANTLSKLATGASDNLLLATYLSAKCNTIVAPAMDLDMYKHPTIVRNLNQLEQDGLSIIPAESGELASGLVGEGRMAEPETIFDFISDYFKRKLQNGRMSGKKVIITAGPTYEAIDPVRFIGNHSSGKMGYELANACLEEGATVTLISGPTNLSLSHPQLQIVSVHSACEMLQHVQAFWGDMDYGIFAAAVADYKPVSVSDQKIKKEDEHLQIELVKNPDILKWAGSTKNDKQLLVGFALETTDLIRNATHKLTHKNLDFIVMNSLQDPGAGFGGDLNKISILDRHNNFVDFELKSKKLLAKDIVDYMIKFKK